MKLDQSTFAALPNTVARPGYDRAALTPGIVHIGVGNFHRAHQAVYMDDLFNMGLAHDWAIIGAGVRAGDAQMRETLAKQDYLNTVIEMEPGAHQARVIGAMIDFLPVEPNNASLIATMARPEIRIVSLTVTEGGYFIDPATGAFDPTHPDIAADAANPFAPSTAFGAIIAALRLRRDAGIIPFTVMSCDNLPGNGHVTQDAVIGLARLIDEALADWITANVAFPNGMVDRITPATGPIERARVVDAFGIEDAAPVFCEPFRQWVLEDKFTAGRPPFERAGVTLTDQVEAYEMMKIRILNGGHAIIAYPGGLLDIEYVHEAMEHPLISAFLAKIETDEVIPIVPPVPGIKLSDYHALITERFANPDVGDTVRRLCLDGSNRQPKFIIPSLRDNLGEGVLPEGLLLLSAMWCRYCYGTTESGAEIAANDPNWTALQARAKEAKNRPSVWLEMEDIYGDLAQNEAVVSAFAALLSDLWEEGTEAMITRHLGP
ncbi:MAG: mannitol 2-dehydrogenase [Halocynthiibacter sp.]|jgi:mannitol 2-dehydrogenase